LEAFPTLDGQGEFLEKKKAREEHQPSKKTQKEEEK